MKVAVVVPAFNAACFLADTLNSVIEQTYQDIEIIVVDDGSTDNTAQIAKATLEGSSREFRILRQENRGVSAARNCGWRLSDASWINFVDADDFLAPNKIAHQIGWCLAATDEVAVIHSAWQRAYFVNGRLEPTGGICEAEIEARPPPLLLISSNLILHGASLVSRAWLERINGFDESMRIYEDCDMQVRLALAGGLFRTAPSDIPLYFWRQVQGQVRVGGEGARYNAVPTARAYLGLVHKSMNNQPLAACGISEVDYINLVGDCTRYMRLLYMHDRAAFRSELARLDALVGNFLPTGPQSLRELARWIGYGNAEFVASCWRKAKYFTRTRGCKPDIGHRSLLASDRSAPS